MKKLCCLLFIFAAIMLQSAYAQDAGRTATATWNVQKYDIDVTLPAENARTITARAVLSLKNVSGNSASSLSLRISPLAVITAVKINEVKADFSKSEEGVASLQRVVTRFGAVAAEAVLTATVDYTITLKDNTSLGSVSPNVSQLLPLSYWYPTPNSWFFPRGADAAPVRLKVNGPGGQKIVSSGVETGGAYEQKLRSQPFFIAGNWDVSELSGISVHMPKGTVGDGQKRALNSPRCSPMPEHLFRVFLARLRMFRFGSLQSGGAEALAVGEQFWSTKLFFAGQRSIR